MLCALWFSGAQEISELRNELERDSSNLSAQEEAIRCVKMCFIHIAFSVIVYYAWILLYSLKRKSSVQDCYSLFLVI